MSKGLHPNGNNARVPVFLLWLFLPFGIIDNAHALQVITTATPTKTTPTKTTLKTTTSPMGFAKQRNTYRSCRLSSSSTASAVNNQNDDEVQINNHTNDVTRQQQQQQQQQQQANAFGSNDTPVQSLSLCHPTRRQTFAAIVTVPSLGRIGQPSVCHARNLPESTGTINTSKVGTVETLIPIVQLYVLLQKLESQLLVSTSQQSPPTQEHMFSQFLSQFVATPPSSKGSVKQQSNNNNYLQNNLPAPLEEIPFKQIFDAYSIPPSYKQKFLNSNAFLVYYTQGYDGPNRPSLEQNNQLEELQIAQYGYRNEAWIAYEEMVTELQYSLVVVDGNKEESIEELIHNIQGPLHRAIQAMEAYLQLVPSPELVQQAKKQIVQ